MAKAKAEPGEIKVGGVVTLRSGGPPMTVEGVHVEGDPASHAADVVWFTPKDDWDAGQAAYGGIQRECLLLAVLRKVT